MTRHLTDEQVENQVIGTRVQIGNLETHVEALRAGERAHRERIEKIERALAELLVARGREPRAPDYQCASRAASFNEVHQRFVTDRCQGSELPIFATVTGRRWDRATIECAVCDLEDSAFLEWLAIVRARLVDPKTPLVLEVRR